MRMKTSSEDRVPKVGIVKEYKNFISNDYLKDLLNSLPYIVAILNSEKQIIFSNHVFIDSFKRASIEDILGLRSGEAMRCINYSKEKDGCGSSQNCNFCTTLDAVNKSREYNKKIAQECRITSIINGKEVNFDFLVTANPFSWNDEKYTILSLNDISNTKRRAVLEHIFFHDVINKVGSLNGFLELIQEIDDPVKIKEYVNSALILSNDLTEDIVSQRELLAAETNELQVKNSCIYTTEVINTVISILKHHEVAKWKVIKVDKKTVNLSVNTDFSLIKRVLINMLKNALEAIEPKQKTTIGCEQIDGSVNFWVHNPGLIPLSSQMQIFQRSFSTKGHDRGIGTYSMKLMAEKYLKGKVYFTSTLAKGTTFNLQLPL